MIPATTQYLKKSDFISKDRATQSPPPGRGSHLPDNGSASYGTGTLGNHEEDALCGKTIT